MPLLTKVERKELVEDICSSFHKDGIVCLKEVGLFSKYTSLYHFTIKEPSKEWPFIFITELFGNEEYEKKASPFLIRTGVRAQYHGNYDGLQAIVMQGITSNMVACGSYGSGRTMSAPFCVIASKSNLRRVDNVAFDHALIYIRDTLHYLNPNSIHCDPTFETFKNTYDTL